MSVIFTVKDEFVLCFASTVTPWRLKFRTDEVIFLSVVKIQRYQSEKWKISQPELVTNCLGKREGPSSRVARIVFD